MDTAITILALLLALAASLALPVWAALLLGAAVPLLIAPALAVGWELIGRARLPRC